jgi:hypothetical protein
MLDKSKSEESAAVELSPSELLVQVSDRVDAIFEDTTKSPDSYFVVKTAVPETGTEVSSLYAVQSGVFMKRSYNQTTGTTSYGLSELYHNGPDQGAYKYFWSTLGPDIGFSVDSKTNGENKPVLKSDKTDIESLRTKIEGYFPKPTIETTKQTLARKALALLRK